MRVVDLRPALEKSLIRRWASRPGGARAGGSGPVARAWTALTDRWLARRVAAREVPAGGPFIVSVGNLALGGTGKTPVIMALAGDLAAEGRRGCVLTRGFRSPLAGPVVIEPDNPLGGDEARLMAGLLHPLGWSVIQARDRARGLAHARDTLPGLDFVLVEDGHQTRAVGRHLDILILDAWRVEDRNGARVLRPLAGPAFPLGPYRESSRGARRAGILLVETDREIPSRGDRGQATARFTRRMILKPVAGGETAVPTDRPYAVLSGIARPEAFEAGLAGMMGRNPDLVLRLRDHADYAPRLVERIGRETAAAGQPLLVTTAKDWIKLGPFWPREKPAAVADLEILWTKEGALPSMVGERALEASRAGD